MNVLLTEINLVQGSKALFHYLIYLFYLATQNAGIFSSVSFLLSHCFRTQIVFWGSCHYLLCVSRQTFLCSNSVCQCKIWIIQSVCRINLIKVNTKQIRIVEVSCQKLSNIHNLLTFFFFALWPFLFNFVLNFMLVYIAD